MSRIKLRFILNFVLLICPFFLMILPSTFFDNGKSLCLSKIIFNVECYGCGMTRALMHFLHFEFDVAWSYNKLAFLVAPLISVFWIKSFYIVFKLPLPSFLKKIT